MRGSSRNGSMDNLSSGPGSPAHGASNGGSQHSNVYVKNLSEDVDELTLKGVFDKFGAVESCCVIRDVSTNSSRGFGFVKFVQVHQAEAAIKEMNGKVIRGKVLEVKFANSDSSATTAASGVGTISDNIYVKGLPPLWTEVELRAFFNIFGTIIECRLLHASGTTTAGAPVVVRSVSRKAYKFPADVLKERYGGDHVGDGFPYTSQLLLAFQCIEGHDVCLFALYVQEYGADCPPPNRGRIYISYVDSVRYLRPARARTPVYHAVINGCLRVAEIQPISSRSLADL